MRECVLNALAYEKLRHVESLHQRGYRSYDFLISDFKAYPDGDKATVTLRLLDYQSLLRAQREETSERLHLQRNGNQWLIIPDWKNPLDAQAPIREDLLVAQATSSTDVEGVPFLNQQAELAACQTNLKLIGLGIKQFIQDNAEKFDLHNDWQKQLDFYI